MAIRYRNNTEKNPMTVEQGRIYFILLFALALFNGRDAIAQETTLISFKMRDQFKREYSEDYLSGKIAIVICSDREGSSARSAIFSQRFCEGQVSKRRMALGCVGLGWPVCQKLPSEKKGMQHHHF
jgi:hypothetical protein